MKKLIVFNMLSLDGYFAGPKGEIDWHTVDKEFNQYAAQTVQTFDTILFGRITYRLFENYWPNAAKDPTISSEDRIIANAINDMTKIVFSKTLDNVSWNNAKLYHELTAEIIQRLKQQSGKDIVIYGSGTVVQTLTNLGLIDEYRFMVGPVVLGRGKPMFENAEKHTFKLMEARPFSASGNVLLRYSPAQATSDTKLYSKE